MDEKFDNQFGIDPQAHIRGQHKNVPESIDWEKLLERGANPGDQGAPTPSIWGFAQDQRRNSDKGQQND